MPQITYKQYRPLLMALSRDKVAQPGKVSTLLLATFLDPIRERKMNSTEVYDLGLAEERSKENFTAWRSNLCKKGWLKHSVTSETGSFLRNGDRYHPGPKLVKYITREKQAIKEMASIDDVMLLTKEMASVDDVDSRIKKVEEQLERALGRIITIIDPPDEPYKRRNLEAGVYDNHLKLLSSLKNDDNESSLPIPLPRSSKEKTTH